MWIESFADKLEQTACSDDVIDVLHQCLAVHHIPRVLHLFIPPEGSLNHETMEVRHVGYEEYPEITRTIAQTLRSITVKSKSALRSFEGHEPHFHADLQYQGILKTLTEALMPVLKARNIQPGLRVAVYGPGGRGGIVIIALPIRKNKVEDFPEALSTRKLQTICQMAHLRICEHKSKDKLHTVNLSEREQGVLRLIVNGKKNSEIAQDLDISVNTVSTYTRTAFLKLKVSNRVEAAVLCSELDLLSER